MPKLPSLRPREVESALVHAGFVVKRQTGSHKVLKHADGREVVLPMHPGDVKKGTMAGILRQANMTTAEFMRFL